jgi:hypothetical protein
LEDHDMSDDYSGYEDDPTAHDGHTDTHDAPGGFGDAIGQPFGEIGGYGQEGHEAPDDTTTYPAEGTEEQADPYATEGQAAQGTDGNADGYGLGFPGQGQEGQADPYATEGEYPAQPASEADPYATDAGDQAAAQPTDGRDAFHTGQPAS